MSHAGYNTHIDCTCTDCALRYPKYFHMHTWDNLRKLDSKKLIGDREYYRDAQEEICKKYNVFLTLYLTPDERKKFARLRYWWITKRILKTVKGWIDKQHVQNQKRRKKKHNGPKINIKDFSMSEKDYTALTGRSTNDDLSFITGKSKKTDYSFITGKGKRKTPSFGFERKDYSGLINSRKNNIRGTVRKLTGK